MDPVTHFEMPADDKNRMRKFYETVFGWKTKQLGQDMGEYVLVTTTETDEKTGFPKQPGAINGGFYQKTEDRATQTPVVTIAVDDLDASIKKLEAAGGKMSGEPADIPGVGRYASFFDTEGNRVSMMQPLPNSPMNVKNMMG